MAVSADTLRKLAALSLAPEQMTGVLAIIADLAEADEQRREKQRLRKAKSRDKGVTVTGQERDEERDNPEPVTATVSPKETPRTPLEKTPSLLPATEEKPSNVAPSPSSGASPVLRLVETKADPEDEPDAGEIPAVLDRRQYPDWFEAIWAEYRPIAPKNSTKADAHRAAARLSAKDRNDLLIGVVRYAVWVHDERQKRADAPVKHLATFIHKRAWERFLEPEDADAVAG